MQIEIIGLEYIQETLQDIERKTNNLKPILNELANHLVYIIDESFETQTTPDGKKWNPIKKATHNNYGLGTDKILHKSGDMRNSLKPKVFKNSFTVGVNATAGKERYQYPFVHQFGTNKAGRNKKTTIVARPFMPIKSNGELYDKTKKELEEIIDEWFELEGIER